MGCATGLVKYLVFIANLVFVLAGLALVVIGVVFKFNYLKQVSVDGVPTEFGVAPVLTIVVGAIVFITAFFGCCGAIRESTCMLTTYAVILLSIFIIQVAIGVFAFLQVKDTADYKQNLEKGFRKAVDHYGTNKEASEAVDAAQVFLECCGVNGPQDYHFSNGSVPLSCCSAKVESCSSTSSTVHSDGCVDKLYNFLEKTANILGYVVIGIAATELLGAIFGLCLASSIRNHYRRNIYA
ncbi:CD63 antigen-like [Coccinella septempunctata]|uniref:CD63 antigen-like n=1 Tax=Coccinella septempunctata TaxID=41139 RepID=UPI001D0803A4|nr:CD63 antigen-like [Coccinella septempunctata]XP_044754488.1 CD63 antigen-like [Coccinella septempunctata]XP_044754490.1 CD63 antigen-like [Coccinella septempunctata]